MEIVIWIDLLGGLLGPSKRLCVGTIGLIEFVWVGILRLPDLTCRYSDIINDSNDVGDELGNMYILNAKQWNKIS